MTTAQEVAEKVAKFLIQHGYGPANEHGCSVTSPSWPIAVLAGYPAPKKRTFADRPTPRPWIATIHYVPGPNCQLFFNMMGVGFSEEVERMAAHLCAELQTHYGSGRVTSETRMYGAEEYDETFG